jgi:hypothetical protein
MHLAVGQPILAAAGFQPAPAGIGDSHMPRKGRLKGGCRQDCLPHKKGKTSAVLHYSMIAATT